MLDSDSPGLESSIKIAKLLYNWGIDTYTTNYLAKDPGELTEQQIQYTIKNKKQLKYSDLIRKRLE